MHLSVGDHRIDDAAAILGGDEFLHLHLPGFDIDLDHRHMAGIGEGAGRIVMADLGHAGIDLALEAVRLVIGIAGERGDGDAAVGAGDGRRAVAEHDVLGRGFQHVRRQLDDLRAQFLRGDEGRAAGDHQRAAGERTPAVG